MPQINLWRDLPFSGCGRERLPTESFLWVSRMEIKIAVGSSKGKRAVKDEGESYDGHAMIAPHRSSMQQTRTRCSASLPYLTAILRQGSTDTSCLDVTLREIPLI